MNGDDDSNWKQLWGKGVFVSDIHVCVLGDVRVSWPAYLRNQLSSIDINVSKSKFPYSLPIMALCRFRHTAERVRYRSRSFGLLLFLPPMLPDLEPNSKNQTQYATNYRNRNPNNTACTQG